MMFKFKDRIYHILKRIAPELYKEVFHTIITIIVGTIILVLISNILLLNSIIQEIIEIYVFILILIITISIFLGSLIIYIILISKIRNLSDIASKDELTGLYNSREFKVKLKKEIELASRHNLKFSLILIDIDSLKNVNDNYGYDTGDLLLKEFSKLVKSQIRISDVFFRYKNGDEFAILSSETESTLARTFVERIRSSVENYKFQVADKSKSFNITMSAGITDYKEKDDEEKLIKRTEEALKNAKKTKNFVARH